MLRISELPRYAAFFCLQLLVACAGRQTSANAAVTTLPTANASPSTEPRAEPTVPAPTAASAPTAPPAPTAAPAPTVSPAATAAPAPTASSISTAAARAAMPAPHPSLQIQVDAVQAIQLANEADRAVRINVQGAIDKYTRALQHQPDSPEITYKLARAYEKKQDWEQMASTLAAAIALAPERAEYHFKRGYALVKLAEEQDHARYEQAKIPLRECVRLDPLRADCHYYLGVAQEHTVDDQAALESYTRAIDIDPKAAHYYPKLAALYLVHKRYAEADRTLTTGIESISPTESNRESLCSMYVQKYQIAQVAGDVDAMVAAMEQAQEIAGDSHPEVAFYLGVAYATQEPPQKERAIRLLYSFSKRTCRTSRQSPYREQCPIAHELIDQLRGP